MSEAANDRAFNIVQHPAESMAVELKTWIDIRNAEGQAKLVRSAFALFNHNGGYLVIGFDDKTLQPDRYSFDMPVETIFHPDAVQSIISRYASYPFACEVVLRERDGQIHPVIMILSGVRVPLIVKSDLRGEGGRSLLSVGDLYFRTLRINNTPSSARIHWGDFQELTEICFNNRESDIGAFLRRQISSSDRLTLRAALLDALEPQEPHSTEPNLADLATEVMRLGDAAFKESVDRIGLSKDEIIGFQALTMKVGLYFDPPGPEVTATREFLDVLANANLQYTGRPVWSDTRGFSDTRARPFVDEGGAFCALIANMRLSGTPRLEFMRLDPRGTFYLRRVLQDDFTDKVKPGTALDVILLMLRVAEVLATGLNFGRALGWDNEARASFAFHWSPLQNREIAAWANPQWIVPSGRSVVDRATSSVIVPVSTPYDALAPYVRNAVRPLFALFEGYNPSVDLVEAIVKRLVERRL